MPELIHSAWPRLEQGDDIQVADIAVLCYKCKKRNTWAFTGILMPGSAISVRCRRCGELVSYRSPGPEPVTTEKEATEKDK